MSAGQLGTIDESSPKGRPQSQPRCSLAHSAIALTGSTGESYRWSPQVGDPGSC